MMDRVKNKVEQIARLRVAGTKDTRIAEIMGMSYGGLVRIIGTPEYLMIEQQVKNRVVGKMDAALDSRVDLINKMNAVVPDALQVLVDAVKQKRDLRAALAASREILDRDPRHTFSKSPTVQNNPNNPTTMPEGVMQSVRDEANKASEILVRVPQQKVAEA